MKSKARIAFVRLSTDEAIELLHNLMPAVVGSKGVDVGRYKFWL